MAQRIVVKNLRGTTRHRPKTGDWLQLWREETGSKRRLCAVLGCSRDAEVGAHVQEKGPRSDNSWKIAPLCRGHNHHTNDALMQLDSRVRLVPLRERATSAPSVPAFSVTDLLRQVQASFFHPTPTFLPGVPLTPEERANQIVREAKAMATVRRSYW